LASVGVKLTGLCSIIQLNFSSERQKKSICTRYQRYLGKYLYQG